MTTKPRTQIEQVLGALRSKILDGDYPSDTRLMEIPIAKSLNVSRTPVRIALEVLEREGLVTTAGPKRGFMVRSFDLKQVFDAIEMRGILEGVAARQLAEMGLKDEDEKALLTLISQGDQLLENWSADESYHRQWIENNRAFHATLIEATQNTAIVDLISRLNNTPLVSPKAITFSNRNSADDLIRIQRVQDDHRSVVDAIIARQGSRAEMIMREHALRNVRNKRENFSVLKEIYGVEQLPGLSLIASE